MAEPSDAALVRTLVDDAAAFEAFYRRHVRVVTGFAARRCGRAADVADVVSSTFLAVLDHADQFDPRRGTARAWLLGIAAHEVSALHRRDGREQRAAARQAVREPLPPDEIALLEARIEAERLAPVFSAALAGAPPAERELFLLVARDELTPSEAAAVLGISPVAARVRLSRVRGRLRAAARTPTHRPGLEDAR
jgi:RNA polymerase sigma factor (sigma-70 family)